MNHLIEGKIIPTKDENLKSGDILIKWVDIQRRLKEMAPGIAERHMGQDLLLVGILKGAMIVTSDLVRYLFRAGLDLPYDFMRVESYGKGTESSGKLKIKQEIADDVKGRNVLLVEDIADTNYTFAFAEKNLLDKGAAKVYKFALLEKKDRHQFPYPVDYVGFQISNIFVGGYGLDFDQLHRGNPNIVKGPLEK